MDDLRKLGEEAVGIDAGARQRFLHQEVVELLVDCETIFSIRAIFISCVSLNTDPEDVFAISMRRNPPGKGGSWCIDQQNQKLVHVSANDSGFTRRSKAHALGVERTVDLGSLSSYR
ncbi:hypothetical protein CWR43_00245 [Rhizobium sullae]|uniref:Uncharacterized protein n=1 Tax=Rhizobium sullae TaxID=50338 RepID=A0A2N0DHI5_RHISU|nr:hypothetical protein [Rhizobium sullae]PKA45506.1 hypothetical protein CWR43_00245 [Rhizobium sullae]